MSDGSDVELGNGRHRSPAERALARHADETAAWIDAVCDERALDSIVENELALLQRATRRQPPPRAAATAAPPADGDDWMGIDELARMIRRSRSWIRHQPPDAIPGRRQHCIGGRVEWSRRVVQAWLDALAARV